MLCILLAVNLYRYLIVRNMEQETTTGRDGEALPSGVSNTLSRSRTKKDKCSFITIIIRKSMDMPSSKRVASHFVVGVCGFVELHWNSEEVHDSVVMIVS